MKRKNKLDTIKTLSLRKIKLNIVTQISKKILSMLISCVV